MMLLRLLSITTNEHCVRGLLKMASLLRSLVDTTRSTATPTGHLRNHRGFLKTSTLDLVDTEDRPREVDANKETKSAECSQLLKCSYMGFKCFSYSRTWIFSVSNMEI